ncbi:class I SAM-dependent methyltransferase [Haloarcula sp. CBA1130]|uniref:class I SAM-dependent methyltransferase n=1 Tax=unclassified Haloarcula TaxID=2624677 RepID=UPI001247A6F8|nr:MULTISPECIES: class I SAM-dependent methyltransferase [unclassified Haloarcula]KAA9398587.1 class I SAM-dependent methyltransferase [Haloarcula sp. CBA1129]KAA9403103.1 class I SAM-dependent methyltransferase [Haloarcula sp. CBA1130]
MDQRRVVREGYDDIAVAYDEYRETATHSDFEAEITDEFFESIADDCRVLDAGCGGGKPVLQRLAAAHNPVGLDISSSQLDLSRERVPTAAFAQGDLVRLPFADDSFNAVVSFYAIIHVPKPEHEQVLAEFHRVLRDGGELLVSMGAVEGWEGRNDEWLDTDTAMEWSYFGPEKSRELIEAAGFEIAAARIPQEEADGFAVFRATA